MDMYPKYKSKFGYQIGNNQIDSYGVDHSGFSLQDELEYQYAREEKENKLLEQLKSRGIMQDLPQYTTDFWGNPANNYGFGTTDIAANIENMQNNTTPIPMATATPQMTTQPITSQVQQQPNKSAWDTVKQWGNDFANATEAGVVGYATGASLGHFDEAMGGATTAFGVDYKGARNAVRQLQNNLSQQNPYIYKGMEMIGAATTPIQLLRGTSRGVQAANALADTINASVGYAENWKDFGLGLISNGISNVIGYKAKYSPGGRALGNIGRKAFTQGINQGLNYFTDNLKNIFYDEYK